MKKSNSGAAISKLDFLRAISDQLSIDIFNAITTDSTTTENLMRTLTLTRKEYYSGTTRLLKRGLIIRIDGKFRVTAFGRPIYNAQLKIATALKYSSVLKMIDAIRSYSGMSQEEKNSLIEILIKDLEIKKLVSN